MTHLQTDKNLQRYLRAVETEMAMSDAKAQKQLDKRAAEALTHLDHVEEHLAETDRHETSLLRAGIDELRVQFALGKMEGSGKLLQLKDEIEHGFRKTKTAIQKLEHLTIDESQALHKRLQKGWKDLKFEIALLNARLELAQEQGGEKLSLTKDELSQDLKLIAHYAKENADELNDRFHSWVKQTKKSLSQRGQKLLDILVDYYDNIKT